MMLLLNVLIEKWIWNVILIKTLHFLRVQINSCIPILDNINIGLISRVFTNGLGDQGLNTKDSKMVLDAAFLNTQYYPVKIKGKV